MRQGLVIDYEHLQGDIQFNFKSSTGILIYVATNNLFLTTLFSFKIIFLKFSKTEANYNFFYGALSLNLRDFISDTYYFFISTCAPKNCLYVYQCLIVFVTSELKQLGLL